jgi:hypothetical protein
MALALHGWRWRHHGAASAQRRRYGSKQPAIASAVALYQERQSEKAKSNGENNGGYQRRSGVSAEAQPAQPRNGGENGVWRRKWLVSENGEMQ